MRFVVLNHTGNGRNSRFAGSEGVECIDSLIGRRAVGQVHQYLYIGSCVIVYLFDFYLAFFVGFQYRVDERSSGGSKRNFGDAKRTLIELRNLSTHPHASASCTIVIATYVHNTRSREIGV